MKKIRNHYLLIIAFTVLYILFTNNNSGVDAYAYAIKVKTGQNLLFPHHLLFCIPARIIFLSLHFLRINADALFLLKLINSISAGFCLLLLFKILKLIESENMLAILMLIGSSFGFMRFATEAETYILPIMFSLWATYYFLLFTNKNQLFWLVLSGLMFAVSILFHQIHIFWFLGFFISLLISKSFKYSSSLVFFTLPSIVLVVCLYFYASQNSETEFLRYIFSDYYSGRAKAVIGINNFIMAPLSLIRTIVQMHGYMTALLNIYKILIIIPVVLMFFLSFYLYRMVKSLTIINNRNRLLSNAVFAAFILHFLFAFFSVGNAEFMVMLPILAIIWLNCKFDFNNYFLFKLSSFIFIWNFIFGLTPLHIADIDGSRKLLLKTKKYKNEYWILYNPQKMENMSEYYQVKNSLNKFLRLDSLKTSNKNIKYILTDHFNQNEALDRHKLLFEKDKTYQMFSKCSRIKADSIYYSFGKKYIYKVYFLK